MEKKGSSVNISFEFHSIEEFLKIFYILSQGKRPSSKDWSSLFDTPGYKCILKEKDFNLSRNVFKKSFKLAFMQSKAGYLNKILQSAHTKEDVKVRLEHFLNVKSSIPLIQRQLKFLRVTPLEKIAVNKALEWLPKSGIKKKYVQTSLLIFTPDTYVVENRILVDILDSTRVGRLFPLLLAHEYHHIFRGELLAFNYRKLNRDDDQIITSIDSIQREGIADCVDKALKEDRHVTFEAAWENYRKFYKKKELDEVPEIIKQIDKLLCTAFDSPKNKELIGKTLRCLIPHGGHTVGFYMACLIKGQFGKRALMIDVGNPFKFFYKYNQAALIKTGQLPVFSQKAIKFLNLLEKKYVFTSQKR